MLHWGPDQRAASYRPLANKNTDSSSPVASNSCESQFGSLSLYLENAAHPRAILPQLSRSRSDGGNIRSGVLCSIEEGKWISCDDAINHIPEAVKPTKQETAVAKYKSSTASGVDSFDGYQYEHWHWFARWARATTPLRFEESGCLSSGNVRSDSFWFRGDSFIVMLYHSPSGPVWHT